MRRNGACLSVPIDRLVPGDIVELIAGDLVPADSRLIESRDPDFKPVKCAEWLECRLPRPVADAAEWKQGD